MASYHYDLTGAVWRKSSHSGQDGNCVEVAANLPGIVAVRDSKDPSGPVLTLPCASWSALARAIQLHEHGGFGAS